MTARRLHLSLQLASFTALYKKAARKPRQESQDRRLPNLDRGHKGPRKNGGNHQRIEVAQVIGDQQMILIQINGAPDRQVHSNSEHPERHTRIAREKLDAPLAQPRARCEDANEERMHQKAEKKRDKTAGFSQNSQHSEYFF